MSTGAIITVNVVIYSTMMLTLNSPITATAQWRRIQRLRWGRWRTLHNRRERKEAARCRWTNAGDERRRSCVEGFAASAAGGKSATSAEVNAGFAAHRILSQLQHRRCPSHEGELQNESSISCQATQLMRSLCQSGLNCVGDLSMRRAEISINHRLASCFLIRYRPGNWSKMQRREAIKMLITGRDREWICWCVGVGGIISAKKSPTAIKDKKLQFLHSPSRPC